MHRRFSLREIFAISEINKELLNGIFTEFDTSIPTKNIINRLNLGELQIDDISTKFSGESTKKYTLIG